MISSQKIVHLYITYLTFVLYVYNKTTNTYRFKLGDFGIARDVPKNIFQRALTFIGSEGFRAPEIDWHIPYNHQVDMYSLGRTMSTMHQSLGHNPSQAWMDLQRNLCNPDQRQRMSARTVHNIAVKQLHLMKIHYNNNGR